MVMAKKAHAGKSAGKADEAKKDKKQTQGMGVRRTDDCVEFEIIPPKRAIRDAGAGFVLVQTAGNHFSSRSIVVTGPHPWTATYNSSTGEWEVTVSWSSGASDAQPMHVILFEHDVDDVLNKGVNFEATDSFILFPE